MTMAVTYGTFAGQTVYEERGGTERVYVPDTLGSTAMLTDLDGNVADAFEYWPYGEERVRTGTTPTPFRFVGTLGYYRDVAGRLYVRARVLRPDLARWQTVDPLWPRQQAYGYVRQSPATWVDPSGKLIPLLLGLGGVAMGLFLGENTTHGHAPPGCRIMTQQERERANYCRFMLSTCGLSSLMPDSAEYFICPSQSDNGLTDPSNNKTTFGPGFGTDPNYCITLMHESLHSSCGVSQTNTPATHPLVFDWAAYLTNQCAACGDPISAGGVCQSIALGTRPPLGNRDCSWNQYA